MLETLISIIHVIVAMALIMIILLQTGKGAGMGAAFGGSSQTLFGSSGRTNFLTKVTIVAAVVFALTSVGLSFITESSNSVMDDYKPDAGPSVPSIPELPDVPGLPGAVGDVPGGAPPADEGMAPDEGGVTPPPVPDLAEPPPAGDGTEIPAELPESSPDTGEPGQ